MKPGDIASRIIAASIFLHPGLIMVDSIHFQYNGMMLGMLLLSMSYARDVRVCSKCLTRQPYLHLTQGQLAICALFFAILLNFKHIFVYLAPPFIVYLFRVHCFTSKGKYAAPRAYDTLSNENVGGFQAHRLVQLALIVGGTCLVSFGPFVVLGGISQLPQIFSRLFPFQRGLNHAYWAANVWAIYTAADRVLVKCVSSVSCRAHTKFLITDMLLRGVPVAEEAIHSSSRGLIGDIAFGVLPEITAVHCFAVTILLNAVSHSWQTVKPTNLLCPRRSSASNCGERHLTFALFKRSPCQPSRLSSSGFMFTRRPYCLCYFR